MTKGATQQHLTACGYVAYIYLNSIRGKSWLNNWHTDFGLFGQKRVSCPHISGRRFIEIMVGIIHGTRAAAGTFLYKKLTSYFLRKRLKKLIVQITFSRSMTSGRQ